MEAIDPFVRAKTICGWLGGCCRRTLYVYVQTGKFPKPDRPAKCRGEPDLWKESTARRGIEAFAGHDA
ncbi:MAG TPA: hypothetical protein VJ738_01315 [Steroidobacteraceae bacterium]|nr:hypothetical protein [Steroidobacteraceae bacterium]